ncbi:MAG: lysine-epsilon-oxidase maturase LodB [Mucilaginibacter sp.]
MTNFETDVLIIGGGPAGASAAISLLNYRQDISVNVIEQSDLDSQRVGEHVSAGIFELLRYLELMPEDFENECFVPTYGNTSYWGIDQPILRDSIFTTESASYQLDRAAFDLTLLKHASEKGAQILPRTKCTQFVQLEDKRWQVWLKHPTAGVLVVTAKFLMDASGRNASVCRHLGISTKKEDQLTGVGAFLQFADNRLLQHNVLLETVEHGWWYSATLPGNTMTVVFFSDADIISKNEFHKTSGWNRLLSETKQIKHLVKGAHTNSAPWIRNAHTQISDSTERENFLAIGDAAAAFDPISSMGIGFAITSACHAAAVVKAELTSHDPKRVAIYQDDLQRNFHNYHQLRQKIYQQEQRWPLSDFWLRRNGKAHMV